MKKTIYIVLVSVVLLIAGHVKLFKSASEHYQLYRYAKNPDRTPYLISIKPSEYFIAFISRDGWRNAPTRTMQPYDTENLIFDELGWDRSIESLLRFYSTDTRDISLWKWMRYPDSAKLPCMQEMSFRTKGTREIAVDSERKVAIDVLSPNMANLYIQTDTGVASYLVVSDAAYHKYLENRKK
jgi:hypothetical protein